MQIRAIKGRVLAYDANRCCVYRKDDLSNELQDSTRPNAQVNRQKCEAFLSVLNLQLGW
jgi:hypothetical protein